MSSADAGVASFSEQDAGLAPDCPVTPGSSNFRGQTCSLQDSRTVRRAIIRVRSAFTSMRLDDALKATAQLKRLMGTRSGSYVHRYMRTLRILEASILAAADHFSASRGVLMSVASEGGDTAAATVLRYVNWKLGERADSYATDPVDYLAAPSGGKAASRIFSLCVSADFAFDRLELAVSGNLATEALDLARLRHGNYSPLSTLPATLLAQLAYEQGRFDEAEALLRPRLSALRESGLPECVARASVLLARLSLHRGQHRAALAILRETEALGRTRMWPRLESVAATEYARTVAMHRCLEDHNSFLRTSGASQISSRDCRLLAGAGSATLPPDDALSLAAVETALQRACTTASQGYIHDSYELLIPWLRIGAARGLRMVFVDHGPQLLTLLGGLYYVLPTNDPQLSGLRPYIASLLRFTVQSNTERPSSFSYRPLSRRETDILQLIARGMSNKRIAQLLAITPETVKSHAKSIFVKLASCTRAQAVSRAEAVGFL